MRVRVLAVLLAIAAAAALLPAVAAPPEWLRTGVVVLAAWTLVSLAATLLLAVWVRAATRADEALARAARRSAWKGQLAAR